MRYPRTAWRAESRGFSLIEVLISLTLLALFIAAAFQVYSGGMRSAVMAGDYARAQTLARSRMDMIAAAPVVGEESGEAPAGGGPTFRWRTAVTDYPLPAGASAGEESTVVPLLAVVEVTWGGGSPPEAPRRFELRALLLGTSG